MESFILNLQTYSLQTKTLLTRALAQVFSHEHYENFWNGFSKEHLRVITSTNVSSRAEPFYNGLEYLGRSKFCGRQPLKNLRGYGLLKQKIFKGCLPQNLLSPLLNSLSHFCLPSR